MGKIIKLTEDDLTRIVRKIIMEQSMGGMTSPQNYARYSRDGADSFNKNYPTLSNFMVDMSLWAIPYVGPYIVIMKNTEEGIRLYKEGKKVEGIISLLTSPLALMKVVRVLKVVGSSSDMVRMVQTVNKTGIPLLVSKGQEAFLNWGYKTFGDDFAKFVKFIKDPKQVKPILNDVLNQMK